MDSNPQEMAKDLKMNQTSPSDTTTLKPMVECWKCAIKPLIRKPIVEGIGGSWAIK